MARRHVVLISQIPLWSMGKSVGGPAIHNTLRVLGQHFRVSLVTPALDYVDPEDLPAGVTLYPFRHRFHGLWRDIRKLGWIPDSLGWYAFRASAWRVVNRLCSQGDVDLLYGYEIYGVPVARKASDAFGIPMVARYQGTTMCFRRYERLNKLRYFKHWKALEMPADLYIMTDDGSAGDEILRSLGHPQERIFFPMNGKDLSILDANPTDVRAALGLADDVFLFITVSRLTNFKRVDRAVAAIAELQLRGFDAHLAVLGVGHQEQNLRSQAQELGIADKVHFVGSVPRDELAGYYHTATGLLALGIYSNLGNPLIEAMVMGTPLFALDEGQTDHLVHDRVNGVLLPDPAPSAVADELQWWLEHEDERLGLGARAREWIGTNLWTWDERMAEEVARLEALIERRPSKA